MYFWASHNLPNLWCHDEYYHIRQGALLNISFEPKPIKYPNVTNYRYKQGEKNSGIFWTIWRTGAKFQVLFNSATCSNYSINNYGMILVFHFFNFFFWKGELHLNMFLTFKNGNCQLLIMTTSCYTVILMKS